MARITTRGGDVLEHTLRTLSEFSPLSYREYADLFGLKPVTAFERMRDLWDSKILHVAEYRLGRSGKPVPFYAIGNIPDAEKPKTLTNDEKIARYRASEKGKKALARAIKRKNKRHKKRMETDPAYAEAHRAYHRLRARAKGGHQPRRDLVNVKNFDPLMAAMMGKTKKRKVKNEEARSED